jgi:hypothetical protein
MGSSGLTVGKAAVDGEAMEEQRRVKAIDRGVHQPIHLPQQVLPTAVREASSPASRLDIDDGGGYR